MCDDGLACVLAFICMAAGAAIGMTVAMIHMTSDDDLHAVGIARIERCHNVHSNWYEIVWLKDKK